MTRRIFGFGTYPIARPREGGQRRVAAFRHFYAGLGIDYVYAAVHDPHAYGADQTGPRDRPWARSDPALWRSGHTGDIEAGVFAADDTPTFKALARAVAAAEPAALQVEQPFIWPLVAKLRASDDFRHLPLVYSSHNVEAPLRAAVLALDGATPEAIRPVAARVERLERASVEAASLVVAVSAADAEIYAEWGARVIVVRNGCGPPPVETRPPLGWEALVAEPYAIFVGGAHLPNVEGLAWFLLDADAAFTLPPRPRLALCGGAGPALAATGLPFARSLARRAVLFPRPDDAELGWLYARARVALLPIRVGAGSNLKTAEALASGLAVVATPQALRSFEAFADAPGVRVADTPRAFGAAAAEALAEGPPALDATERAWRAALRWDGVFAASGLASALAALLNP